MRKNEVMAKKFLSNITKNVEAFKEEITSQVSQEFLKELKQKAPQVEELKDYQKHLEHRISGHEKSTFAVALDQEAATLPVVEPIILYMENRYKAPALLLSLMKKYQPFTQHSLPFIPDPNVIRVLYKKVTQDKFNEVYEKNLSDWTSMGELLQKAGIQPRPLGEIPKINIYEDMADRIAEIEKTKEKHWVPTVEKFRSGIMLDKVLKNRNIDKAMVNKIKTESSKIKEYTREDEASFQKFEKEIL